MMSNQPKPDERWDSGAENVTSENAKEHERRRDEVVEKNAAAEHQRESEVQQEGGVEATKELERRIAESSKGSSTGQSSRPPF